MLFSRPRTPSTSHLPSSPQLSLPAFLSDIPFRCSLYTPPFPACFWFFETGLSYSSTQTQNGAKDPPASTHPPKVCFAFVGTDVLWFLRDGGERRWRCPPHPLPWLITADLVPSTVLPNLNSWMSRLKWRMEMSSKSYLERNFNSREASVTVFVHLKKICINHSRKMKIGWDTKSEGMRPLFSLKLKLKNGFIMSFRKGFNGVQVYLLESGFNSTLYVCVCIHIRTLLQF